MKQYLYVILYSFYNRDFNEKPGKIIKNNLFLKNLGQIIIIKLHDSNKI